MKKIPEKRRAADRMRYTDNFRVLLISVFTIKLSFFFHKSEIEKLRAGFDERGQRKTFFG